MGDKPGKYWDHRECRWVACPVPAPDAAVVPSQPRAADAADADTAAATDLPPVGSPQ